jgi:aldehyde dehydrogenase (NAD+)
MTTFSDALMYIGGRFRTARETVPVVEAATEDRLGAGASATAEDVDDAVAAARQALPGWRAAPVRQRADVLSAFAASLRSRAETTGTLVSRENGMPIARSRPLEGGLPATLIEYFAELVANTPAEETRPSTAGHTIVRHEAVGVVAAIVPWNYPQALAAFKLAPALAAGCTVVLKAAPETALDAVIIADAAAECGLPPGVLNVVPGGPGAGARLVAHPGVDKVAFTGSSPTGRTIAEVCGRLLRPVTLELGGKSAAIILDDADLEFTMRGLRTASFAGNGQVCNLSTRILAPRSRYQEVVDAVAALADSLVVGDPLDPSTETGPLVSAQHRGRVLGYISIGKSHGAKLVAGGSIPSDQPRGWFVSPTVFADVNNSDRIAREEIFGPVVTITPYATETEAVDIANDSEFGLAGSVWSADTEHATAVARSVVTGTIGVNGYQMDIRAPFGGVKASGMGRELGPEGLQPYQNLKSIYRA